ncbi:hypothetical protein [Anatilimnocola floriformis]|uniref:hypothetical protein n=1 Tax=Anatilimnocola floriformis TaxID=2948575 RepID=UPI0020C3E4CF|nr:hypothetical protein [Anatilimnocola floriformis]
MRVCDLNSGMGQLSQAYGKLRERLVETREVWKDAAFEQFDRDRLNEIPARLQRLTAAVNALIEVVDRAERECGEPRDES